MQNTQFRLLRCSLPPVQQEQQQQQHQLNDFCMNSIPSLIKSRIFQLSHTYERNLISVFQVAEEAYSFEEQKQIDLNISPVCQRNAGSCSNFITIEQSFNLSYHNVRRCCSLSSSWGFLIGCQSTWRFCWNHRKNTLISPVICSTRR